MSVLAKQAAVSQQFSAKTKNRKTSSRLSWMNLKGSISEFNDLTKSNIDEESKNC